MLAALRMPMRYSIPVLALGTAAAAVAVAAVAMSRPEVAIGRSFASAIERQAPSRAGRAGAQVASDFDRAFLHLSSHPLAPAVGPTPVVQLGDRISFSGADGAVRSYLVVDVRSLPIADTAEHDSGGPRLLLVTADSGSAAEPAARGRCIDEAPIETPAASLPLAPRKPHAL